jgi:hypothetical protein
MNFFRLRFINTLLVLFIGIVLGYIMKERTISKTGRPYVAKYPAAYPVQSDSAETPRSINDALPTPPAPAAAGETAENPIRSKRETGTEVEDFGMPVKLSATRRIEEPADPEEISPGPETKITAEPSEEKDDGIVRGSEDAFFKNPSYFSGRDLEMDLQMIMARRTDKGWLLNLVRSKGDKNVDYLYVEDESVVGDKPDLKIGYSYKVRFRCRKGDSASGNRLLRLTPTNEKAPWATGVSAIE